MIFLNLIFLCVIWDKNKVARCSNKTFSPFFPPSSPLMCACIFFHPITFLTLTPDHREVPRIQVSPTPCLVPNDICFPSLITGQPTSQQCVSIKSLNSNRTNQKLCLIFTPCHHVTMGLAQLFGLCFFPGALTIYLNYIQTHSLKHFVTPSSRQER